jgi:hypothetical protein
VVWLANLKHDALVRRSVNVAVFSSISSHVEGGGLRMSASSGPWLKVTPTSLSCRAE